MALGWKGSYYRYREFFLNISALYKKRADLRAFFEIILSILAIIIFLLFALKPTVLTIVSLVQQIKEEKQTLSTLTQKVNDLQKANTLLSQYQQFVGDINVAVATAPAPDVFVKQVQGLASKNAVTVAGITINEIALVGKESTANSSGDYKPLPENAKEMGYSFTINGNYSNVLNFLKDFENLRVTSAIDDLTIGSSTINEGRVIVAIISGRVPYLGSNSNEEK